MNRRQFFKALGSSAGAIALSTGGIALLEQELWQPTKSIFLPPQAGWVSSTASWELWVFGERTTEVWMPGMPHLPPLLKAKTQEALVQDLHRLIPRPKRYIITRGA